jgi:hypothetical protein
MTTSRGFKPIQVRIETYDKLKFIASRSDRTLAGLMSEIVDHIFQVACTFSALNLEYDTTVSEAKVCITVRGKNRLVTGSFQVPVNISEAKETKEIRKRIRGKTP